MPLFHMNAVSVTTMSALYAGGSTVISPRFSAAKFWNIISDYGITSFGSVATMLSMLLNTYPDGVPEGLKTDQLRFAMCGSAPVPAEVIKKFEEIFNCPVIEGYGLSESTCRSTFNPPDERRRAGRIEEGREILRKAREERPDAWAMVYNYGCWEALAGNPEEAIAHLRRAREMNPDEIRPYLEGDTDLDPLRDDPRFQELLA